MTAMWPAHLAVPALLRSPAVPAGQKSRTLLLSTSLNIWLRLKSTTAAYIWDICHFLGGRFELKIKLKKSSEIVQQFRELGPTLVH